MYPPPPTPMFEMSDRNIVQNLFNIFAHEIPQKGAETIYSST